MKPDHELLTFHSETKRPVEIWPILAGYLESHKEFELYTIYILGARSTKVRVFFHPFSGFNVEEWSFSQGIRIWDLTLKLPAGRGPDYYFWTEDRAIAQIRSLMG